MKLVRLESVTFTGADGEVFDMPLFGGATLTGDLPGEGVDTVRWSEPIPMSATLTVKMSPSDGRRMARFVRLLRDGVRNRPRIASTRSRRARRTAATKRRCQWGR